MLSYSLLLIGMTSREALASEYQVIAVGTEQLIRIYDPAVRSTKSFIGIQSGLPTACGKTDNSEWEVFFCGRGKEPVIVFSEKALNNIGKNYGLEPVAATIAHEYAHARLYSLQGMTGDVIGSYVVDELQADCVTGVYLRRATPIQLSNFQVDKVEKYLENLGDYMPIERDWHGTPQMRGISFKHGYNTGNLDSCLASKSMNWNILIDKATREMQKAPETVERLLKWGEDLLKNKN